MPNAWKEKNCTHRLIFCSGCSESWDGWPESGKGLRAARRHARQCTGELTVETAYVQKIKVPKRESKQ